MAVITCGPGWKGIAVKGGWQNHESNLNEDEMIALAGQITNIAGMSGVEQVGMHDKFKRLREVLASATDTISITKGVHQRDSKVHFDVAVTGARGGTYHVFVAPGVAAIHNGQTSAKGSKIQRKLAAYLPSGLSILDGIFRTWPSQFSLADLEKPVGRPRGYSLSIGNSSAPASFSEMMKGSSAFHNITAPILAKPT